MSNISLSPASVSLSVKTVFETMAYNSNQEVDVSAILKWLKQRYSNVLSSSLSGAVVENKHPATKTFDFSATQVGVRFIEKEGDFKEVYRKVLGESKKGAGQPNAADRDGRLKEFQTLVQNNSKELACLEAFAGQVPLQNVKAVDEPVWIASTKGSLVERYYDELINMNQSTCQILVRLSNETYSLKSLLPVLSAVVQAGVNASIFIAFKEGRQENSLKLLLPILFLLDLLNKNEKLMTKPLNVILLGNALTESVDVFKVMSEVDKEIVKESEIDLVIVGDLNIPLVAAKSAGLLYPSTIYGKTVSFVVDSTSDLDSALQSIVKQVWTGGIELNHQCRPLLFVHEPVYSVMKEKLANIIGTLKVKEQSGFVPIGMDFVARDTPSKPEILSVLKAEHSNFETAAKSLPITFQHPTLFYDVGLASGLVALKKNPGLGHLLAIIPYRTETELANLANSLGTPDKLYIFANLIDTAHSLAKSLKARSVVINFAKTEDEPVSPWLIISKSGSSLLRPEEVTAQIKALPVKECKAWADMSLAKKLDKLKTFNNSNFLLDLLEFQSKVFLETSAARTIPNAVFKTGVYGLVVDEQAVASKAFDMALSTLILRGNGKPIIVATLPTSGITPAFIEEVVGRFPPGFITFTKISKFTEVTQLAATWEVIWALVGNNPLQIGLNLEGVGSIFVNDFNSQKRIRSTAQIVVADGYKGVYM